MLLFCLRNVSFNTKWSDATMVGFPQKKPTCTPQQATAITASVLTMLVMRTMSMDDGE